MPTRAIAGIPVPDRILAVARQIKARGLLPWKPLVPEAAFTVCVRAAIRKLRALAPGERLGHYLEFGVSRGTSTACVYHVLRTEGLQYVRLVGFDSFEGLPPEAASEGWAPGQYKSTLAATRRYLAKHGVDMRRVLLVKGWFKDSLTEETRDRYGIGKASLILIDCDIYSASKDALEFCAPHIRDRAVILFDDWGWKADKGEIGQKEAFEEFLEANPQLTAEPLPAYRPEARVFMVTRLESQ